ncbi:MAG: ABC transporter substrate-binding protein [Acetobacteraceae bacterium]
MSNARRTASAWLAGAVGLASLGLAAGSLTGTATAAEVKMGIRTDASSIDPHYHVYSPNTAVWRHIFDALVWSDPRTRLHPALAVSYKPIEETVWEFKLRPNVTFHDGTPFTAEDVAFSLARAPVVPNSPSSHAQYTKLIARTEVVDPLTIRIHTKGPAPTLPIDMASIAIVSKKAVEGKATSDFNSGAAAIGTGPYRFVEWTAGNQLVLEKNPTYWKGVEPWDRVVRKPIANDGARVAALLAGDVDLIEGVPGVDRARLAATPTLALHECDSIRIVYLHMDSNRDASPEVTDVNGNKLDRNPMKDARVRQAMSMAINRQALTERLLSGQAKPANQYMPAGLPGYSEKLPPLAYDPVKAQALLKEAGWSDGFGLVLNGSNDRFASDAQVTQAVGQMLARIGIKTEVRTMPAAILFSRGSKLDFSAILSGWIGTGDPSSPLTALMATYNPKTGMGPSNRGRWSNAEFDTVLAQALRTLDYEDRSALYAKAAEIAVGDMGVIPVYHTINTWGSKKGLVYDARADEQTHAMGLRKAQ